MDSKTLTLQATEQTLNQEANCRLDRWLALQLPHLSRSRIQSLIEEGHVCLNDEQCTSKKQIVVVGDRLSVDIPEAQPMTLQPEAIPLDILYEDAELYLSHVHSRDHLLITDKTHHRIGAKLFKASVVTSLCHLDHAVFQPI